MVARPWIFGSIEGGERAARVTRADEGCCVIQPAYWVTQMKGGRVVAEVLVRGRYEAIHAAREWVRPTKGATR